MSPLKNRKVPAKICSSMREVRSKFFSSYVYVKQFENIKLITIIIQQFF